MNRLVPESAGSGSLDYRRRGHVLIASSLWIFLFSVIFLVAIIRSQGLSLSAWAFLVGATLILMNPIIVWRTGSIRLPGTLLVLQLIVFLGFVAYLNGGLNPAALVWTIPIPLLAALIVGRRLAVLSAIVLFVVFYTFYAFTQSGFVFPQSSDSSWSLWFEAGGLATSVLFLTFLGLHTEDLRKLNFNRLEKEIAQRTDQLAQANQKLEEELNNRKASASELAELYDRTKEQLKHKEALQRATVAIGSSLELEEVLQILAWQMANAVSATSAYISSFDLESHSSTVLAEFFSARASEAEQDSNMGATQDLDQAFHGEIAKLHGGEIMVVHLSDEGLDLDNPAMLGQGARSVLTIPLQIKGETIAVAEIWESRREREFGPNEIALCQAIARQAAIAIENARLFQKAQQEIKDRTTAEEKLIHDAFHDELSGLPNRALFMDRLKQANSRVGRQPDLLFAVLFMDIDRFKTVNDSLGHSIGDELLFELAQRMGQVIRPGDTVARLGGDEFGLLIEDMHDPSDAIRIADRILNVLSEPFNLSGYEFVASASVGIAISASGYTHSQDMVRDADLAMYRAKRAGGDRYQVFSKEMHSQAVARLQLETDIHRAIEREELRIFYQPIVSVTDERLKGFEALVRWQNPYRGLLTPPEFLRVAEENGAIVKIDRWVLTEACKQLAAWHVEFDPKKRLTIAVNFSARQLKEPDLVDWIEEALRESKLAPGNLVIEVTEDLISQELDGTVETLREIRALGVQLHLDDFGKGHSALGYLNKFPVDTLKIDRSFIEVLEEKPANEQIVRTIIDLAHNLGMHVVAEGVETAHQLSFLVTNNCDFAQGYYLSAPINRRSAERLLRIENERLRPGFDKIGPWLQTRSLN